ncbi:MAG: hypothetical protein A3H91_07860 [Gammaproteobacteria bacterium RIFCSPLOWO2_02_FULL_61_13]|nr:MAG: hypothetical protein A3H91_07860 [Gammaproteobacteria bacterium RIFCSPLOWO2_02_FULL_61_13]
MKLHIPLLSTVLIVALASGSDVMGYYSGDTTVGTAVTTIKGTLNATVGPGFTITLKRTSGVAVTSLKAGTWRFVVDDKSVNHNFHLTGPGSVNKATTVSQIRKITWTVTLKPGTYTYKCDPHATSMKKTFKVIA